MNRQQRREQRWDEDFDRVAEFRNDVLRECMPEEYFRKKVAAVEKLQRNGITVEELKENYVLGYNEGFKAAGEPIVKGCFAAICLVLNEKYGFGRKRCHDVLSAVDQHLLFTLTSDEAIAEVWDKIGLQLEFNEPFDRVQEKN